MQFKKPKATEKAIKMLFGRSQNCAVVVITILGLFLQGTNSSQLQEMEKPGKKPWIFFHFDFAVHSVKVRHLINLPQKLFTKNFKW